MRRKTGLLAAALIAISACRAVPKKPTPPPAPPPGATRPTLEKTFGEAYLTGGDSITILYKDLRIMIDPNESAILTPGAPEQTDFVLVTRAGATSDIRWSALRRDQKIVGPGPAMDAAREGGLPNVKALSNGQRLMLSKSNVPGQPGAFLFVTAIEARNPASGELVSGFLLEFDNGRNVFVSSELVDVAVFRQFVYQIRDDGKEIDLAFLTCGGRRAADRTLRTADEELAGEIGALVQPKLLVLLDAARMDRSKFQAALESQMFSGQWYVSVPPETIAF
ncbi:MAG: MBL fold metallo-hydrolase [Elusimicrobia bacterium]|nr:MBL fold metallo-hydrolase [Elusimicrobiota bacterium]